MAELATINPKSLWHHPILPIFVERKEIPHVELSTKLYLTPTLDNLTGEVLEIGRAHV